MATVLVVDDEALIRWSLSQALGDAGHHVLQASSRAEARAVLADHECGSEIIVLLDLRLPDVSDLSFLREILTTRAEARVVMMTAHGTAEDAARATALGASGFVSKPFDVEEIARRLRDW